MENITNVELSYLSMLDYQSLKSIMLRSYPRLKDPFWKEEEIRCLLDKFPEGQVSVKVNGEVVGCALSIVVKHDEFVGQHNYEDVTTSGSFDRHTTNGDMLYGLDVVIKPEFRGLRLGRRLYEYRKELCEQLNLKGIILGGRIPNYHKHADKLTPKEYIQKVRAKEIHDPVLDFQISNDFSPKLILKGYLEGDNDSSENAVLLEWFNIYYEPKNKQPEIHRKEVRLGLIQWQMRPYANQEQLMVQVEYFINCLGSYNSDFALFPEFFNAPLMAHFNHLENAAAMRKLAEYTQPVVDELQKMAISYNINIVTGSMPEVIDGNLYNIGYLCHRDGRLDRYEKLHVTPDEKLVWGTVGGNNISTFDTDCGKVGILICYDVEFPELGRILADEGMDILFVPFFTDTQNGYSRVRTCAHARAIENECFVAIAGCVGNLPNVQNMHMQYAQSMVFTPCDFAFPSNGIKAEATPNTEMVLIADVNLIVDPSYSSMPS